MQLLATAAITALLSAGGTLYMRPGLIAALLGRDIRSEREPHRPADLGLRPSAGLGDDLSLTLPVTASLAGTAIDEMSAGQHVLLRIANGAVSSVQLTQ